MQTVRGLHDGRGEVHGGSFLRERRIAFNCTKDEFPRIFVHELFHFVWVRSSNQRRRAYEDLLRHEWKSDRDGELGWSAEWRKRELRAADLRERTRPWREYCCESFCDTAAWLYSGIAGHPEFTLSPSLRTARREWYRREIEGRTLPV